MTLFDSQHHNSSVQGIDIQFYAALCTGQSLWCMSGYGEGDRRFEQLL